MRKTCLFQLGFYTTFANICLTFAGWETARGMTSFNYLWNLMNRFQHPYSTFCLLGSPSSLTIMLFPMGRLSWIFWMVSAQLRELNTLLEGLKSGCIFLGVCSKPVFQSASCFHFAHPLLSGVVLAQVCHCRFLAKVWHSCVLPSPLPGSNILVKFAVEKNMCASWRNVNIPPTPPHPLHSVQHVHKWKERSHPTHPTPSIAWCPTCVQAEGTLTSHPPHPIHCIASNMCTGARNVNIPPTPPHPLNSVQHVCKCKEGQHPTHPTPSIAWRPTCVQAQGTLTSHPPHPHLAHSNQHARRCKER